MLRAVRTHCTVPSDDANYDPPKFAGWRGRPKVFSLYGVSCLFFLPVGFVELWLVQRCEEAGHDLWQAPSVLRLDALLMMAVAITALHGDVIKLGSTSYWHVADRLVVLLIFALAAAQAVVLLCLGPVPFALAVSLYVQPLRCYGKSYAAREWDTYEVWHVMWHAVAATNKVLGCVLAFAACDASLELPWELLLGVTAVVVGLEALAFQAVDQVLSARGEKGTPFVAPEARQRKTSPRSRAGGSNSHR